MKNVLVALLVSVSLPAVAAFKCVDSRGNVSIQDLPCAGNERASTLNMPTTAPTGDRPARNPYAKDAARFAAEEREQERQPRAETAIHQKTVFEGMREDEVIRALGRPTHVNRASYGPEQWVYARGHGNTVYVYVEKGVVHSWQEMGAR